MRDIKFRAWHNKEKAMLIKGDNYGTTHNYDCLDYSKKQDVVLMEFTSLHDMNNAGNTDVYEYDILIDGHGRVYKVEWDYKNTGWAGIRTSDTKKISLPKLLLGGSIVIGNIYENKELLC